MRVAGVDPGTIRTGVGIVEKSASGMITAIHHETIEAGEKKPLAERLRMIYGGLKEVFSIYRPETVAIESVFFSKDFKAAVKIGEARAIAMLAAMEHNIPVSEYMPNRIKESICGNGRASKEQIQFMVKQVLKMKELPLPDAADALAIAYCHLHTSSWNIQKKIALGKANYV